MEAPPRRRRGLVGLGLLVLAVGLGWWIARTPATPTLGEPTRAVARPVVAPAPEVRPEPETPLTLVEPEASGEPPPAAEAPPVPAAAAGAPGRRARTPSREGRVTSRPVEGSTDTTFDAGTVEATSGAPRAARADDAPAATADSTAPGPASPEASVQAPAATAPPPDLGAQVGAREAEATPPVPKPPVPAPATPAPATPAPKKPAAQKPFVTF